MYPQKMRYIVHTTDEWVCSSKSCGHPIGVHCAKREREDHDPALTPNPCSASPRFSSPSNIASHVIRAEICWVPVKGTFNPPSLGASSQTEADLQTLYSKHDKRVINFIVLRATNTTVSLHCNDLEFKPDLIVYDKDNQTESGIVSVIELKAPNSGDIPPDVRSPELKQLLGYLHAILKMQKRRFFVFGVLTNHKYLVAVKAQRLKNDFQYVIEYAAGFRDEWIQFLLESSLDKLGAVFPTVVIEGQSYVLRKYLGSGQYSHGYELDLFGTVVVVKQCDTVEKANVERATCIALQGCKNVSQLHCTQPDDRHFVSITPRGYPFGPSKAINGDHVDQLFGAVTVLHSKGLVHGDICASNIFYVDSKTALLNDWSHVKSFSVHDMRKDFRDLLQAVKEVGASNDLVDHLDDLCTTAKMAKRSHEE